MAFLGYIAQGEFAIGDDPFDVISATLGSCISVCLWDPLHNLGGMNHILLPGIEVDEQRHGSADMEQLINALLRRGAARERLTAKVFGGASMLVGRTDIGAQNTAFAFDYLRREEIPCVAKSTGGNKARQVKFFPHSGNVKHRFVSDDMAPAVTQTERLSDIELF